MKIIEALKELPLLKKRMERNYQLIQKYSSMVESDTPEFETVERQQQEVDSLIQANVDLASRYENVTNRLAITNATVKVEIEGVSKTIREWITFRNVTKVYLDSTYSALQPATAEQNLRAKQYDLAKGVKVVRFYKEEDKLAALGKYQLIRDKIDATLEIANVNTDLVD
jgi:hypothetical protein